MSKPALRSKPTKLELDHPTEGKCGWVLEVVGFDSSRVRSMIKQVAADRASRSDNDAPQTVDTMTADQIANAKIAAAAVIGWNQDFADADESIGAYTPEKAFEIMADEEINWIREQVEACLRQRATFFRGDKSQAE